MTCEITPRSLERITPPMLEPLGLAETKLYLRIDNSDEDLLVLSLMQGARDAAEQELRRSLMSQQWRLSFPCGVNVTTRLPMGPVQSVVSVSLLNQGVAPVVIDPSRYSLSPGKEYLLVPGGLAADTVEIVYQAGYASAEQVPSAIRYGMLCHVAALYADRGLADLPESSRRAFASYREVRL